MMLTAHDLIDDRVAGLGSGRPATAGDVQLSEPGTVLAVPRFGWSHGGSPLGAQGALRQVTGVAGTAGKETSMNAARSWGYRHPYAHTGVRTAAASWNLLLGILLLSHGYRWGSVLLAVSALIFWAAYIMAPGNPGPKALACSGSCSVPS